MDDPSVAIRPATRDDLELIVGFIRDLAEYEKLTDECVFDPATLGEHLFGPHPYAEVLLAEAGETAVGFAFFFMTYSTFLGRPGIWLEDLFVTPAHRRGGVGRSLLSRVAAIAVERGCGRLEWSVLDWNRPAIDFYQSLGAKLMDGWTTCRVEGATLGAMAGGSQTWRRRRWKP